MTETFWWGIFYIGAAGLVVFSLLPLYLLIWLYRIRRESNAHISAAQPYLRQLIQKRKRRE